MWHAQHSENEWQQRRGAVGGTYGAGWSDNGAAHRTGTLPACIKAHSSLPLSCDTEAWRMHLALTLSKPQLEAGATSPCQPLADTRIAEQVVACELDGRRHAILHASHGGLHEQPMHVSRSKKGIAGHFSQSYNSLLPGKLGKSCRSP